MEQCQVLQHLGNLLQATSCREQAVVDAAGSRQGLAKR